MKGYGQKFVSSQWDKSVFSGFFTGGTQLERKGLQQDIHYRIAYGNQIVCKRFIESNTTYNQAASSVYQQNYYSGRDKPEKFWHLPESIKVDFNSKANPDPRDKQSCGKFEVVKHGELWTVNSMNRSEKIESVDGTRIDKIQQFIVHEDYIPSTKLGKDNFVQSKQIKAMQQNPNSRR